MNPFELFLADHRPAGIWACGKCRVVARDLYTAERCCGPHFCPKCGRVVESTYDQTCDGCLRRVGLPRRPRQILRVGRRLPRSLLARL